MIKKFLLSMIMWLLMIGISFAGAILNNPMFSATDDNGDPLTGGLLYSYTGGTTTAKSLYTDKACTTADTNPVVLDSRGEAEIYGTPGGYKLVLKTSADVTIWTIDNVDIATNNESYLYFPDASQADQGAATAGGNLTVKDFVDSIGATIATIVYVQTGVAATTTYTFSSSETIGSTITNRFENGARAAIATGVTLTISGKLDVLPGQQIFNCVGTGTVAGLKQADPGMFGDDIGDGTVVANTAFTKAIASLVAGGVLKIPVPDSFYNFTDTVIINKSLTVNGLSTFGVDIRQATSQKSAFHITASDVSVKFLKLTGPQYVASGNLEYGIRAFGADKNNYLENINITDCYVTDWGGSGIEVWFVDGFKILRNKVYNIYAQGIMARASNYGDIDKNHVENVVGPSPSVYGILVSRSSADTTIDYPHDINVTNNYVKDVTNHEGIDTHGGDRIKFIGNTVIDCRIGILCGRDDGYVKGSPTECIVSNNIIRNASIAVADVSSGIIAIGNFDTAANFGNDIIVSGNNIYGHGSDNAGVPAMLLYGIHNLSVHDNNIHDSGKTAIGIYHNGDNWNIHHNNIYDITEASGYAFYFDNTTAVNLGDGIIANNNIDVTGHTAFYWTDYTYFDFSNNNIINATVDYAQSVGSAALDRCIGTFKDVARGVATWDPASINAGSSANTTFSNIPGMSTKGSVSISHNRDLQGMIMTAVTANTDTSEGAFTVYLYNNTAGAIDLASLSLYYNVEKR